jgi:hypothetical protein
LQEGSNAPVRAAAVDVEICTQRPFLQLPGPEGTPHSVIWKKDRGLSEEEGRFEFDLRPWKAQMSALGRNAPKLSVYSSGVKAPGFADQRVIYTGPMVKVVLFKGFRMVPERTRWCD